MIVNVNNSNLLSSLILLNYWLLTSVVVTTCPNFGSLSIYSRFFGGNSLAYNIHYHSLVIYSRPCSRYQCLLLKYCWTKEQLNSFKSTKVVRFNPQKKCLNYVFCWPKIYWIVFVFFKFTHKTPYLSICW